VRERCKEAGFHEFVQKPVKALVLKNILYQFSAALNTW